MHRIFCRRAGGQFRRNPRITSEELPKIEVADKLVSNWSAMHQLGMHQKSYEAIVVLSLAFAIPVIFVVPQLISLSYECLFMLAPFMLFIVAFSFILRPPREYLTLIVTAFEITIFTLVLAVSNFPDSRKCCSCPSHS